MALALTLAAFTGGALGVLWQWLAGEDVPEDQIQAATQLEETVDEEPDPEPSRTVTPPAPSPNP
jgi:hypothetical protein